MTITHLESKKITVDGNEIATFAGGCFWCMEPPFEQLKGVTDVVSGYIGGTGLKPTYKNYAQKGYIEAIQVHYDPQKISYDTLLDTFWRNINPTDASGQFVDRGPQYRSAIFYHTPEQKKLAEGSKQKLSDASRFFHPIATEIMSASPFYKAEEYHQNYYKTHPYKYKFYRYRSGRDQFLEKNWENIPKKTNQNNLNNYRKLSDKELRAKLTPLQYKVTQQRGTELPFKNEYWNNTQPGIYVDIVSGEPLFSTREQFESGTGWPSFTQPLEQKNIVEKKYKEWFSTRIEIRSTHADSHLGDLFYDGPAPTGLRYCMNSAAFRFIPVKDLEKEGYGKYKELF